MILDFIQFKKKKKESIFKLSKEILKMYNQNYVVSFCTVQTSFAETLNMRLKVFMFTWCKWLYVLDKDLCSFVIMQQTKVKTNFWQISSYKMTYYLISI